MKIAIDARELQGKPTGVGRYLSELLAAWTALPAASAHEFILLRARRGRGGTAWEQLDAAPAGAPRRRRRAASPRRTPGRCARPVPMVVAIHDVSFAAHPEWFSWREGVRRRLLTRLARAPRGARADDLGVLEARDRAPPRHRCLEDRGDLSGRDVDGRCGGAGPSRSAPTPFRISLILFVGSVFNRRHMPELIEGFARLARRHSGARLEIVGDNRTTPRIDLRRPRTVVRRRRPDPAPLVRGRRGAAPLYRRRACLRLPVRLRGLRPDTARGAVGGHADRRARHADRARDLRPRGALRRRGPSPAPIEAALERALFDTAERARLLDASAGVLARYSWDECARRTLQILLACGR